ncbi:MAG: glycosyl hydrolase 2 galactose-binding domain-containing protein [Povalibacter sp.]
MISLVRQLAMHLWWSAVLLAVTAHAEPAFGPYHARFLAGGEGVVDPIDAAAPILDANAAWTIHAWIRSLDVPPGPLLLGGFGDPQSANGRYLGLRDGKPILRVAGRELAGKAKIAAGEWHFLAATYDGKEAKLYVDGSRVAKSAATLERASNSLQIAPDVWPWTGAAHFGGEIAGFSIFAQSMSEHDLLAAYQQRPNFELINFADVSVGWPWQVRQQAGLALPQPASTLPRSNASFSPPRAVNEPAPIALRPLTDSTWQLADWRLIEEPRLHQSAAKVSMPEFDASQWYQATVPGTVLTTLVNRGVYPDPDYGLNNMAIPESLARQSYWYRTQLSVPQDIASRRLTLTFNGINYSAEVWLNGEQLGSIKGAFIRGVFDVSGKLHPGANALAVRVSPPPHPGIPHEESVKAGPGENGGAMALDGPTFLATEGWDWIPGIRDRNTGLWQDVVLSATDGVLIRDPQVITHLPLPDTSRAEITIKVPLQNRSTNSVQGTLIAAFENVTISKDVTVPPGETTVSLAPQEFKQLLITQPRLWWPNGYGTQELYQLKLQFQAGQKISDTRALRFGIREITYELSLFDERGQLRRVDVSPTVGSARGERLIDVRHEAIKKSPKGWAASLYPGALKSPGVTPVNDDALTPYLALKVNGVRIASRGGNWGMDDARKRISRERLEPYFRLHREANLNTIRNWVGLNYEDEFFDLADEYGMLVLSDFWASTQDFQVEPEDPQLFLANARDTIKRYRNHPSIALWFGRNEGVPQPILNSGLADLVAELDGTRHFTGSSNRVNLQGSGPYNYRPPAQYFTDLAQGYSVEVGTPSLATLESIKAWIPAQDLWPLGDAIAYHDWHFGGNGDVASFMRTLDTQFGAPKDLEDFERKAQMMNYVTYRAVFEGFHSQLWTRNSGRLLWMTHPAWPSNHWQIYSSDYDTHASFYGVKKACEPIHVQMNLPDYALAVVNTTRNSAEGLSLRARILSLDNQQLDERREHINAPANSVTTLSKLDVATHLAAQGLVIVKLELTDASGRLISENLYWQGADENAYRKLNQLPQQELKGSAVATASGQELKIQVRVTNQGTKPALANKLTLIGANGERILPAFYSDNYLSLLPGESREVMISYPASSGDKATVHLRGWNTSDVSFAVRSPL